MDKSTLGFYRGIFAGTMLWLAAGCASPPAARTLSGNVVPRGTPIVIQGMLDDSERVQLMRKLEVYGFAPDQNGISSYSVLVRFDKPYSSEAVCVIDLIKDGVPLVSARNESAWYLETAPGGGTFSELAFFAALRGFEKALYGSSSPLNPGK
jgi:hypothetical protein